MISIRPDYFVRVGEHIEEHWKQYAFSECAFAEIATRTLDERPPCESVSFLDAVRCSTVGTLPPQTDIEAVFGQPPVTVYQSQYFRIELLFWLEGVPSIHQHAFSGAFHVLHGASLHSEWTFDQKVIIRPTLLLGEMALNSAEVLSVGDTRSIEAGNGFIHSTFHLGRPSVTVVVRTIREEHNLPQYSYWPPSIAYDLQSRSTELVRRLQVLQMLARTGRRGDFKEIFYRLIDDADTFSLVYYLFEAYPLLWDEAERNALSLAIRFKQPEIAGYLIRSMTEQERRNHLVALRHRVENPDLQFFLALLLNVPRLDMVLDLIRSRYAMRDPVGVILEWLVELRYMRLFDTELDEYGLRVLSCLLRGIDQSEMKTELMTPQNGCSELRNGMLSDVTGEIKRNWLLGPLLTFTSRRIPARNIWEPKLACPGRLRSNK
jgi:hypothetical protein